MRLKNERKGLMKFCGVDDNLRHGYSERHKLTALLVFLVFGILADITDNFK